MIEPCLLGVVVTDHPVFIGVLVGLPSAMLGYLGYRQARKNDAVAAQAGIATAESGTISQVIEGQNKLVANLQTDNAVLRTTLDAVNTRLTQVLTYCEELKVQVAELSKRLPQPDSP